VTVPSAYCRGVAFVVASLLLLAIAPASAQSSIGSAVSVVREVSGILGGRTRTVGTGDGVFSNENIRTANASTAQLQFLDQSNLTIGPSASVVLDRFIYNPDRTARQATVQIATGAARWVGGTSQSRAYRVRTPHAVIGVRGTAFDVLVELRRTIVTLREGVIQVCAIGAPQQCRTLDTPGQVVVVTPTTITGPTPTDIAVQFADRCLRPIDRSACVYTETAQQVVEQNWRVLHAGIHLGGTVSWAPVVMGGSPTVLASIALGNVPTRIHGARRRASSAALQIGYTWQFGDGSSAWRRISARSARMQMRRFCETRSAST
jgi:hypothetical protein